MIIKVVHADGALELLTLIGPVAVHEGTRMAHLSDAGGMDHYFNFDGTYDGWGSGGGGSMSTEEADRLIQTVQGARHIEPPALPETE